MPVFEINGVQLEVPQEALNPRLRKALRRGQYETAERAALGHHLGADDRLLDLGAGAGLVSILAAQKAGAQNVTAVEAAPQMLPVLRGNFERNGVAGIRLLHGAVVPSDHADATIAFEMAKGFWASRLAGPGTGAEARVIPVPALPLGPLMREVAPSVVTMDVEGAEVALAHEPWPASVRILIMEIHPNHTTARDLKTMFDTLSQAGFTYMPKGSRGAVVVLQRVR